MCVRGEVVWGSVVECGVVCGVVGSRGVVWGCPATESMDPCDWKPTQRLGKRGVPHLVQSAQSL